jgi:hypothetical protein
VSKIVNIGVMSKDRAAQQRLFIGKILGPSSNLGEGRLKKK